MDLREQFIRELLESYLSKTLNKTIPMAIRTALKDHSSALTRQEFIPLKQAREQYGISHRSLYNYHRKGYITLRTTEGKTFVSVFELEDHIRKHPIARMPAS